MTNSAKHPSESIAVAVVQSMTGEDAVFVSRMGTGDQHFVYMVNTAASEYVIRMTLEEQRHKFEAALYWQKLLLPLGVPLAQFIQTDLAGKHSPFPALLMQQLPGDDLINVCDTLTDAEKKNLASEIIQIQARMSSLPEGPGFGIADSYEHAVKFKSWYDFLMQRLCFFKDEIKKSNVFESEKVSSVISIAKNLEHELKSIRATPFLWDASERNVLVHEGRITGIVDVDEICFGDPLFVIALTSIALALEGKDTVYTDYWAELLKLDATAKTRLAFYKLFYVTAFMRKHSTLTTNNKKVLFDAELLNSLYSGTLVLFMRV